MRWFAILVAAVVGAGAACQTREPSARLPDPGALDDLARPLLGGGSFDPLGLAGKVVVLNFWSPG